MSFARLVVYEAQFHYNVIMSEGVQSMHKCTLKLPILFIALFMSMPSASACLAANWHTSLLHAESDTSSLQSDIIGYGRIISESVWVSANDDEFASDLKALLARQQIEFELTSSSRFPSAKGHVMQVRFAGGTCGPWPAKGQSGDLFGQILEADENGLPTLILARTQSLN